MTATRRPPSAPLLLASGSARRRSLLRSVGIEFGVVRPRVDERWRPRESGRRGALRLARAKAEAVAARRPGCDVLAADTVVLAGGAVLGKPRDPAEARAMLRRLSGGWHQVVTAVVLHSAGGRRYEATARTRVRFAALRRAEIESYVASGEPYDKAGGYAIQGSAAWFVAEVRGSVTNVIGLPLEIVRELFTARGRPIPPLAPARR